MTKNKEKKLKETKMLLTKEDVICVIEYELRKANRLASGTTNSAEFLIYRGKVNVCRQLIKRVKEL